MNNTELKDYLESFNKHTSSELYDIDKVIENVEIDNKGYRYYSFPYGKIVLDKDYKFLEGQPNNPESTMPTDKQLKANEEYQSRQYKAINELHREIGVRL